MKDKNGWTALFFAVRHGDKAMTLLLLENQTDITASVGNELTALQFVAAMG